MKKIISFLKDEQGATAVEYAIMASAIAAIIILLVYAIGGKTSNAFGTLNTNFK